jgi:hypothetical protein
MARRPAVGTVLAVAILAACATGPARMLVITDVDLGG